MRKELVLTDYMEERVKKCREAYENWQEHMQKEYGSDVHNLNDECLIGWALDYLKEHFEELAQEDEDEAAEETDVEAETDYKESQAECS